MRGVAHGAPRRFVAIGAAAVMVFAVITINQRRVVAENITTTNLTGRIALGDAHTCAIHEAESVWCWGSNSDGQLGLGAGSSQGVFSTPQRVPEFGTAAPVQVVAGKSHTCARLIDGSMWCWGKNGFGAVSGTGGKVPGPRQVVFSAQTPDLVVTQIFAGGDNTCALMADTSLMCWGVNSFGQLGIESIDDDAHNTPTRVKLTDTSLKVLTLAIGASHMCARAVDNRIWCWGANHSGQSSDREGAFFTTPHEKFNVAAFGTDLAVGAEHTCTAQGSAAICFGLHNSFQAPDLIVFRSQVEAVYAGGNFSCVRLREGAPQCWGSNSDSQLGTGTASTNNRDTAHDVAGLDDTVVDMSLGKNHACAAIESGQIRCWGDNDFSQLGQQEDYAHHTATAVPFINIAPPVPPVPPVPDVEDRDESPHQDNVATNSDVSARTSDQPLQHTSPAVSDVPFAKRVVVTVKMKRGLSLSSKRVSKVVSLAIPKKSEGKMRISIVQGAKNCRFVGTSIRAMRKGTCTVAVTLMPKKGKKVTRNMVISIR